MIRLCRTASPVRDRRKRKISIVTPKPAGRSRQSLSATTDTSVCQSSVGNSGLRLSALTDYIVRQSSDGELGRSPSALTGCRKLTEPVGFDSLRCQSELIAYDSGLNRKPTGFILKWKNIFLRSRSKADDSGRLRKLTESVGFGRIRFRSALKATCSGLIRKLTGLESYLIRSASGCQTTLRLSALKAICGSPNWSVTAYG